jgi:hypothetical protein
MMLASSTPPASSGDANSTSAVHFRHDRPLAEASPPTTKKLSSTPGS